MSSQLVFITGATGFIGAATAQAALRGGYRLRISVRKEAQIESIKEIFHEFAEKLEFAVVPDITAPGAFAEALNGVDYVLHLASPLASSTNKEEAFKPAVDGTLSVLRDAGKVASIKKVVITSSIAALRPLTGVPEGGVVREDTDWDLSVDPEANFDMGNDFATAFNIYVASKLLANKATWDFVANEKPHFEIFTIHPSFVYGHSLVQKSATDLAGSTNNILFGSIMNGVFMDAAANAVYVGDVADAHVRALDPRVKKGTQYYVSGPTFNWNEIVDIMERDYPGVPYKLARDVPLFSGKGDTSRVERELGITWAKPEVMIKEVLDQQLAFLKA